nr:tyrosine-protein phosphatase [Nonomuraea longispora]
MIRPGAIVRSDNPERLTAAGWSALVQYGVRTVVDLRNDDELQAGPPNRPACVTTVHVPLDDVADTAFCTCLRENELDGTPLYYRPFLDRKARHRRRHRRRACAALRGAGPLRARQGSYGPRRHAAAGARRSRLGRHRRRL